MAAPGMLCLPIQIQQDKEYAEQPTFELPAIDPVTLKNYILTLTTYLDVDATTGKKTLVLTQLLLTEEPT